MSDVLFDRIPMAAFSAATRDELKADIAACAERLAASGSIIPILAEHRNAFDKSAPFRATLVFEKDADISETFGAALSAIDSGASVKGLFVGEGKPSGKVAFLFPGQGSQYVGMGAFFKGELHEAAEAAFQEHGASHNRATGLLGRLFPEGGGDPKAAEAALRSTDIAQPAIGVTSLAMKGILDEAGIRADAVCGHSYGELSALCAAGVLSKEDFLKLSVLRGRFMAGSPGDGRDRGTMLAVRAPLATLEAVLAAENLDVVLANRNSPEQGVLSGATEAIDHAATVLRTHKIRGMKIPVAAAFHSPLVADAAAPFAEAVSGTAMQSPAIPVFSNGRADVYPETDCQKVLADQLLSPVRFVEIMERLWDMGVRIFIEVGPGKVLTGLANACLKERDGATVVAMNPNGARTPEKDVVMALAVLMGEGLL